VKSLDAKKKEEAFFTRRNRRYSQEAIRERADSMRGQLLSKNSIRLDLQPFNDSISSLAPTGGQ